MVRNSQFLAAAATVAFLALGSVAFAMSTAPGRGGPNGGGPNGPGPAGSGPGSQTPIIVGCDVQADQKNLFGPARRAFVSLCHRGSL